MKKSISIFFLIGISTCCLAQAYKPADQNSEVKFTIRNFGLNVTGSFKGLNGSIIFNPENLAASGFNVSVQANTVNTGNNSRDKHLKKEDYFDVEKYPVLNFTSAKISNGTKPGVYFVEGLLTIKNKKKNINFPFTTTSVTDGYQLQAQFKINRRDFNVGGNSLVLSDELTVSLKVYAKKE